VLVDVAHRMGHAVAHDIAGETPLALGDPDPAVDRTARLGIGDEPLPVLWDTPVAYAPGMVTMSHPIPFDAAACDFEPAAHPPGLLDPVHRKPGRQPVRIVVVAECIVNAVEGKLYSHVVAVVGHHARLAQLRLGQGQPVEGEVVQVGVVGDLSTVQLQRERSCVRPPDADVVAGLPAAGEVEVDLHAEFVLGHGQLPEQAVTCSLPGDRSVAEVIGGAQAAVAFRSGGHCAPICTVSACPRLAISRADCNEVFSMLRISAFLAERTPYSGFSAMVSAILSAASSAA